MGKGKGKQVEVIAIEADEADKRDAFAISSSRIDAVVEKLEGLLEAARGAARAISSQQQGDPPVLSQV